MIDEHDINQYAARQLKILRTTTGLTQKALADEMHMSPQQVQKYEHGLNRLSVGKLFQFAEVFDVSITLFFPQRDRYYSPESVPTPTIRFIRLIAKIAPAHYDQVYVALKAIAKLSGSKMEE